MADQQADKEMIERERDRQIDRHIIDSLRSLDQVLMEAEESHSRLAGDPKEPAMSAA